MKSNIKKIKIIIFIVLVCLAIWFLGISPIMQFHSNEKKLEDAARRYFELNEDRLPSGERVKTLKLNTLYKESYLDEDIKMPYTGKVCSLTNSWVKVSRVNGQYKYYTYLDCGVLKSSIDHEGPVIEINGDSDITINVGDEYKDLGVNSVSDDVDGQMKETDVEVKGKVDTNRVGKYEIEYIAFDSLSNRGSATRTVTVVDGLKNHIKKDLGDKLVYSDNPDNNYIMFSHVLFRIVGLDENGNIIIVANEDIANVNYTKLEKWLDNVYYKSIDDPYKKIIVKNKYCNMKIAENELDTVSKCTSFTNERYSYVLSIFDIKNADSGNDSYLKPSTASWTANRSGDKTAYITKAVFFADDYGKSYDSESDVYNYGVRPMLTIKGNLLLVSGDGSFDDPYYVVKEKKAKGGSLVNTRKTGEYIKTGGMIWRIVGVTDDGLTKVISNDTLSCTGERVVLYSADKDGVLNYNPKEKQNVGYYINNQATKCFDADDFSIHEISVPLYKKEIIYGQEVETKKYKVKFSAPNMYDMFSAQPNEYDGHTTHSYWLVNSSKSKMMQGVIYDIGIPENKTIEYYQRFGIRVVGYLKNNVVVSSGSGTYSKPFVLK